MEENKKKKAYSKPRIKAEGNVEKITLKALGTGDGYMFAGGFSASGANAS